MLTLIVISAASVNAQVIIGGNGTQYPHAGAGLDLSPLGKQNLGLLLPSVKLMDKAEEFALVAGATDGQKKDATGMLVYNADADILDGRGLYVWDGAKWQPVVLTPDCTAAPTVSPLASDQTSVNKAIGSVYAMTVAANVIVYDGAAKYQWQSSTMDDGSEWNDVIGATTDTYTYHAPTAAANLGTTTYYRCKVKTACGAVVSPKWKITVVECSGGVVYGGAYDGPEETLYLNGHFLAGWNKDDLFTAQGKDLCWAASDISERKRWQPAKVECEKLTTDNSQQWRLPNLQELQVLYEALGGTGTGAGSSATDFSVLDNFDRGVSNGASAMQSYYYWSSTEYSSVNAYRFNFNSGDRFLQGKKSAVTSVRCVRSL
jgi:hypothetical protein